MDIFGHLKNIHKNPKFGKVRQVTTREFPTKFLIGTCPTLPNLGFLKISKNGNPLFFPVLGPFYRPKWQISLPYYIKVGNAPALFLSLFFLSKAHHKCLTLARQKEVTVYFSRFLAAFNCQCYLGIFKSCQVSWSHQSRFTVVSPTSCSPTSWVV